LFGRRIFRKGISYGFFSFTKKILLTDYHLGNPSTEFSVEPFFAKLNCWFLLAGVPQSNY
ncbi:MAG: hypothetical protein LKG36_05905, partial [[Lactobacillus] timonensis]|nr:hypothetical protein [[Lactobacillus] timonensis]